QGGDAASKAYDNALKKFNDDIGKLDIFPSKKIGVDEAGEAVRREGQSLYDRLSNYADIDPRKVTEGDRLRRLESRKRELDNFFAVAFDSPSRFRQYTQFLTGLENVAKVAPPETQARMLSLTGKMKDEVITRGLFGSMYKMGSGDAHKINIDITATGESW